MVSAWKVTKAGELKKKTPARSILKVPSCWVHEDKFAAGSVKDKKGQCRGFGKEGGVERVKIGLHK